MIEFVTINGTAVRVTGCLVRTVEQPDGESLNEVDLVVILRGQSVHETFLALLGHPPLLLEIPPDGPRLETTVAGSSWITSGGAYRHELTLREIADDDESTSPSDEPAELDAARIGLRLEALIEALDRAGVVNRTVVDELYRRLVEKRFVADAPPD